MMITNTWIWKLFYGFFFAGEAPQDRSGILYILYDYRELFMISSPVGDMFRSIGFWIIKTMHTFLSALLEVLQKAYQLLGFYDYLRAEGVLGKYEDVMMVVFSIALVVVGIFLIIGASEFKGSKVLKNIAISALVLMILPFGITTMNELTTAWVSEESQSIGDELSKQVADYIYDNEYIFQEEGGFKERYNIKNTFNDADYAATYEDIWEIDINERVNPENPNEKNTIQPKDAVFVRKLFGTKLIDYNSGRYAYVTPPTVLDLRILEQLYYRYSYNFLPIFIIYIAYAVVIIFTIIRCVRLAYEIVGNYLIATLLAVTDLMTGKKLKEALLYLLYTYLTMMYCATSIVFFTKFNSYLQNQSFGPIANAFFMFAVALAVIDGPAWMQRIFGIDAGIKDGYNMFDRLSRAGRGISRTARTAAGIAVGAGMMVGKGVGKGVAAAKNMKDSQNKPGSRNAEQSEKSANELYNKRDAASEKDIPLDKSGAGGKTSNEGDLIKGMNGAKGKSDGLHAEATMRPRSNIKGTAKDHGAFKVPINYANGSSVSPATAIKNAVDKEAASRGINPDDYYMADASLSSFNVGSGSQQNTGASSGSNGKPSAGSEQNGETKADNPEVKPEDPKADNQATEGTGPEFSDSAADIKNMNAQADAAYANRDNSTKHGLSMDKNGKKGSQAVPTVGDMIKAANNATDDVAHMEGTYRPKSNIRGTAADKGDFAVGANYLTGGAISASQAWEAAVTSEASARGVNLSDYYFDGSTASVTGYDQIYPDEEDSSGFGGPAPSDSPAGGPSPQPSPVTPEQPVNPASPGSANSPYYAPVNEYNSNPADYSPIQMPAPKNESRNSIVSSGSSAVGNLSSGTTVYTEVEMIRETAAGSMEQKTEKIGFTYTTGSNESYKKAFNKMVTEWTKEKPEERKGYRVGKARLFQRKKKGGRK